MELTLHWGDLLCIELPLVDNYNKASIAHFTEILSEEMKHLTAMQVSLALSLLGLLLSVQQVIIHVVSIR